MQIDGYNFHEFSTADMVTGFFAPATTQADHEAIAQIAALVSGGTRSKFRPAFTVPGNNSTLQIVFQFGDRDPAFCFAQSDILFIKTLSGKSLAEMPAESPTARIPAADAAKLLGIFVDLGIQ